MANVVQLVIKNGKLTPLAAGDTPINASGQAFGGQVDTDGTLAANADARIASQKAVKTYVDSVAAGLKWKQSVKAATTGDITLANEQTIDGVALVAGNRVLVRAQADNTENGIYTVVDGGAWTRTTDTDAGSELVSAAVFVEQGTANADTAWVCTSNAIVLETDPVVFSQFSGGSVYTWGYGLTNTGSTVNLDTTEAADLTTAQTLTNKTLTSPVLNTSISGTAFKDEDDLVSDSATSIPSQQSVKAYVDGKNRFETFTAQFWTDGQNQLTGATVFEVVVPYAGYLTSASVRADTAFSAGKTLALEPAVNGTGLTPTGLDLALDDDPTQSAFGTVAFGTSGYAVAAGDVLSLKATTSGVDFAASLTASLVVKVAAAA